ncbi:MAG TPA: PLP-dependent cysteine synthase family protein [Candidatus Saccharimonadales bacterium]|nr:PLP-dependent cysteine synthase family protein [Candidatus Saccharimonadales bacterium]
MRSKMIVANSITDLIGKTPIVRINHLTGPNDATVYAKLEWYNIGGSVKDRLALYILEYARTAGRLDPTKTILEATSGNTGIALAMIAAAKGYKIALVMPESVSTERRRIIKAYGAELILSPGPKGTAGAIEMKQNILKEKPDIYIDVDQFKDPANILAHYQTTGREILEQTHGNLDMIVIGVGTAGTGVGTSMRVRETNPAVKIIGVTPKLGTAVQGLRNPKEAFPTQLFRPEAFDEVIEVTEEEKQESFKTAREVARREGLLIGMSAGSIIRVALKKAKELGKGKTIVAVLPDGGERYWSTPLYGE